jgi:hypothetical protein
MRIVFVGIQARCGQCEALVEKVSRYTVRPGTPGSTLIGPFQLVKRGTHRPQASEDMNMHGRV